MASTAVLVHDCGNPLATTNLFRVGLAQTLEDLIECQRLRFLVFNCELGEGLDASAQTGLDRDQFDFICDHLMVHDASSGRLAGTYRLQSGYRAKGNLGYYGEEFFDFTPFEEIRKEVLELDALVSIRIIAILRCSTCSGKGSPSTRKAAAAATSSVAVPSPLRMKTRGWHFMNRFAINTWLSLPCE